MNLLNKKWFWLTIAAVIIAGFFLFVMNNKSVDIASLADKGKIVVGFKKDVSQLEAENILNKYGLEFLRTGDVNQGKIFFYESGEKFIVKVPEGKEQIWIDKFNALSEIYKANWYITPIKVVVD